MTGAEWDVKLQSPAVLVNADSREGSDRSEELAEALRVAGIVPRFFETAEGEDLEAALKRAVATKPDFLIAAGGDGTITMAAAAAMEAGVPLGVVALGTGNSFARKIGVGIGVEEGLRAIEDGHLRTVDVGLANTMLFLDLFSVGASSEVVRHVTPELKGRWGRLAYLVAGAEALSELDTFHLSIDCDGKRLELESLFVACGPGPIHGGVAKLHPDALADDGWLYGYALDAESSAVLLQWGAGLVVGDPGSMPGVHTFRGARIEVETSPPLPMNLDGEERGSTPATLRVQARALQVFAPEPSAS